MKQTNQKTIDQLKDALNAAIRSPMPVADALEVVQGLIEEAEAIEMGLRDDLRRGKK